MALGPKSHAGACDEAGSEHVLSPLTRQKATELRALQQKFKDLLHQYKLDDFHLKHHQKDIAQVARECMTVCEDVLAQKYHYHFHRLPDANRAEIINMINNYTREAILPPVVEKLVERQVLLERRMVAMQRLIESTLEVLSHPPATVSASR